MKFKSITTAIAVALALASAGAQALIVNIDATTSTGTDVTLDPGSYTLSWAGIAGGGRYDAWTYNTAPSGNYRNTFSASFDGNVYTVDRNDGAPNYNQYSTAAAALADFQNASGQAAFQIYSGTTTGASVLATYATPIAFTLITPTSIRFTVPDHILWDNTGGVSLSITAVPEPETYALMLAGLAAVGFVARRRPAQKG